MNNGGVLRQLSGVLIFPVLPLSPTGEINLDALRKHMEKDMAVMRSPRETR
jgi:hypothetical protein